jgi:DNA-binding GntR family transcriptional regulator
MTKPDMLSEGILVRRPSIRAEVAEVLRAALISGRMEPGAVYSAPQLGELLGVSATPVREAMLDLVREGMVVVAPNKGFRVVEPTDEMLDRTAELRLLIEVPIMAEIAAVCEGEVADAVRDLGELATQLEAASVERDLVRFVALDTEFHTRFLALHGNPLIVDTVRELRGRSRLYGLERLAERGLLQRTAHEHVEMIALALARDAAGMRALVAQHIGHVRGEWARSESAEGGVSAG